MILRVCFKSGLLPPGFAAVYTPVSKSLLLKQALEYCLRAHLRSGALLRNAISGLLLRQKKPKKILTAYPRMLRFLGFFFPFLGSNFAPLVDATLLRCALIILACVELVSCSHLFYVPSKEILTDPKKAFIEFDELRIPTRDGLKLNAWLFKARLKGASLVDFDGEPIDPDLLEEKVQGTVVQFHGNAENMTSHFLSLFWLTYAGYQVLVFDYRGYGTSEGSPSQEGLNSDALAVFDFLNQENIYPLKSDVRKPDLIYYGQSLGGAVLARAYGETAHKKRVRAVIIEGSFYSYRAVAQKVLAQSWVTFIFQPFAYILISDAFSPMDFIPKISPTPLLVIHGTKDRTVPYTLGQRIFELARNPKEFWSIKGGKHIDAMNREKGRYRNQLVEYLKGL